MPYISDPEKLTKELESFGESLVNLVIQLNLGKIDKPQVILVNQPESLPRLRFLLYSVLHQAGLKEQYRIRVHGLDEIVLEPKTYRKGKATWVPPTTESWSPEATGDGVEGVIDLFQEGSKGD